MYGPWSITLGISCIQGPHPGADKWKSHHGPHANLHLNVPPGLGPCAYVILCIYDLVLT